MTTDAFVDTEVESVGLTRMHILEARQPLLRLAYVLTGSSTYAEDVVQDVMEQALRKVGAPIEHPGAYLRTMVINRVRTLGRKAAKDRVLVGDLVSEDPRVVELADLLLKLKVPARTVLVLRYYEQWSIPEIARALKKPEGTVKSIVFRALAELKKELSHD